MSNPSFIDTFEQGDPQDKMLLGGKGANPCAMTQLGLNVPPGFVVTIDYASCSAPRVPVARLAAAQAQLGAADYGRELAG